MMRDGFETAPCAEMLVVFPYGGGVGNRQTLTVEDWCNRQIENGDKDPYGGGLVKPSQPVRAVLLCKVRD